MHIWFILNIWAFVKFFVMFIICEYMAYSWTMFCNPSNQNSEKVTGVNVNANYLLVAGIQIQTWRQTDIYCT